MHFGSITSNNLPLQKRSTQAAHWITRFILPAGWLALLTGMFWIGDRSLYHKLYYLLLAAPSLAIVILQPRQTGPIFRHPLVIAYIFFASYICFSIFWSDSETPVLSLLKRPAYVLVLIISAGLLASTRTLALIRTLKAAALIATASALLSYGYFLYSGHGVNGQRFSGYGALYNPLLTGHIYGFFAAFWLASWFTRQRWVVPLICFGILALVVISTGSRTPLLALSATASWLCLANLNRRSLLITVVGAMVGLTLLYFYPAAFMSRGLSYRPEIWMEALNMASQNLLLGLGYDHQLMIELKGTEMAFNDPHNIELAVLLAGGLVGLAFWIALYTIAMCYSWRNRTNPAVMIASALLVFGLASGFTEGRDFLSRPKEHWFLIWIPFSLLLHAWLLSASVPTENIQQRERN